MNGGRGLGRSQILVKFAPWLALIVFALVLTALAVNFIQDRRHPEGESTRFDPVKNFSQINSRGMVKVLMRKQKNS